MLLKNAVRSGANSSTGISSTAVTATDSHRDVRTPFLARGVSPTPRFCPTKVVLAMEMDWTGRIISWSTLSSRPKMEAMVEAFLRTDSTTPSSLSVAR